MKNWRKKSFQKYNSVYDSVLMLSPDKITKQAFKKARKLETITHFTSFYYTQKDV